MATTTTTNVALQKPVVEKIQSQDLPNLIAAHAANADLLETTLAGSATINTNPSIVNTAGARIVYLYSCSAGSISTITGMKTNVPFTLVNKSSGASLAILDSSPFLLSAAAVPSTVGSNITLVWDGTNYIEVGKVAA